MPNEKSEPQQTEALVKQDALPALGVVKNKNGTDRIVARQKGKFTKTANARVLAVQKSIERLMHALDDEGQTQLEKIISSQAKVCEENSDARNLGGISKFLEHVDEISGSKAVLVGKDGRVENAKAMSGPTPLRQAAIDAVKQWAWEPILLNSSAIRVRTRVTLRFDLHNKSASQE